MRRALALAALLLAVVAARWHLSRREEAPHGETLAPHVVDARADVEFPPPAQAERRASERDASGDPGARAETIALTLRVVDPDGAPVAGVEVVLCASLEVESTPSPRRCSARTDPEGATLFEIERSSAARYAWVVARHAGFVPATEFVGDRWAASLRTDGTAEFVIALATAQTWSCELTDLLGRPIEGATVRATAAWGEEARTRDCEAGVVGRLAPETRSRSDGTATLALAPDLAYLVDAFADGYAPFACAVAAGPRGDVRERIRLRRLFVAGFVVRGLAPAEIGMLSTAGEEYGDLSSNPRWLILLDRAEAELRASLELRDATLRFRLEELSGATPDPEPVTLVLPGGRERLELDYRPLSEFTATDLAEVVPEPAGTATVKVRLRADEGTLAAHRERGWCLRKVGGWRSARPSSSDESGGRLTFTALEAGQWYLTSASRGLERAMPPFEPFAVAAGEIAEVEFDVPRPIGTRLRLRVHDAFGRDIVGYRAFLQSARGLHVVRDHLLPVEPGRYALTIEALGYPECCVEVELAGDEVEAAVCVGMPSGMTLPWER